MSSQHVREIIDRILPAIHSYTIGVRVGGGVLEFNFVDRELEVRRLLDPGEGVIVGGWITVLYGPKGCGKTELFKALSSTVASLGDVDVDIVIVSSEREAWRVERLYAPRSLAEVARGVIESLGGSIEVQAGGSWEVKGFVPLDKLVSLLVGYIAYRLGRRRNAIIVVDEVRADGTDGLSEFRGWLEGYSNQLRYDDHRFWRDKGGSIAVVTLTSDAVVKEVRSRVGSKVNWAHMWNLDPGSLGWLARRLNIDVDVDTLWRLTGGNPRALVRIRVDGLKRWVEEEVLAVVRELLDEARRELGERLWDELRVAVENIDEADYSLKQLMLKHNIILYITGYKVSELPRERWVGGRYAYQIPAYYHALKLMVERANAKVTVEELLEATR
jgi:energy-coupling factor transporter ATP-binding protein EcfA2